MSDATDKALDQITEAEALTFISELRSDLTTANTALTTTQADLSEANQSIATDEAQITSLKASLATAEASLTAAQTELDAAGETATVATSATVVPSKVEVIKHEVNGNRLMTVLSTDSPTSGTLTVHVS